MISAEELNKGAGFSFEEIPAPPTKTFGQIWTIRPDISDWLDSGDSVPPLFPVIFAEQCSESLDGASLCTVIPVHHLRENAASDDLFFIENDKPLSPYMAAPWAHRTIFTGHLDKYLGSLKDPTLSRLKILYEGQRVSRDFTGTEIVNKTDFRLDYRSFFIKQVDMLSLPVDAFDELLEEARAFIQKSEFVGRDEAMDDLLAKAKKKSMENILNSIEFSREDLCEAVNSKVIELAGGERDYHSLSPEDIDAQIHKFKKQEGSELSGQEKTLSFLSKCFKSSLSPYPLKRAFELLREWQTT